MCLSRLRRTPRRLNCWCQARWTDAPRHSFRQGGLRHVRDLRSCVRFAPLNWRLHMRGQQRRIIQRESLSSSFLSLFPVRAPLCPFRDDESERARSSILVGSDGFDPFPAVAAPVAEGRSACGRARHLHEQGCAPNTAFALTHRARPCCAPVQHVTARKKVARTAVLA